MFGRRSTRRAPRHPRRLRLESLELRDVPATIVWTGQQDNGIFQDPRNWSGGVAPGPGDEAVIGPAAVSPVLIGNAHVHDLTVAAGGHLTVGTNSTLTITNSAVNLGTTTIDQGTVYFNILGAFVPGFTNRGLFEGSAAFAVVGFFRNDGGTIRPGGGLGFQRLFANTGPTGEGTLALDLNGPVPGDGYDQIATAPGPEDPPTTTFLGGQLVVNATYAAAPGEAFRIIDNRDLGPISGTFNGLPEGATLTAGGQDFRISYAGGDGNDVTLTREPVPVAFRWDGRPDAGGTSADNLWSNPANWVGDVAPAGGEDLVFPADAAQLAAVNDFPAGTAFGLLSVVGPGYQLDGNVATFAAGVTADIATGASTLALSLGGAGGLTKAGGGTLVLSGANTFAGATAVTGGRLDLAGAGGPTVPGDLVVNGGTVRVMHDDQIAGGASVAVNVGGTFDLNGHADAVGAFTVAGGTALVGTGRLAAGPVAFDFYSTLALTLDGAAGSGGITVTGPVALGGPGPNPFGGTLQLTLAAPVPFGTPVVLIDNDGTDAIAGRFVNVAEGTLLDIGGTTFRATYRGGAGDNDLAATALDPSSGQIAGTVFTDINGNGQNDADPGLGGVTVQLDVGGDGTVDQTTTTADGGAYSFGGLPVGTFRVRIAAPVGYVQTTADPADVPLAIGQSVGGVDFGAFELVSISGTKFNDRNGDGVRNNGEPGVGGVQIRRIVAGTINIVQTVTTAADGSFTFTGVGPGVFHIREQTPAGTTQTTPDPADVTTASGTDTTGLLFGNRADAVELVAAGAGLGGGPHVRVYNRDGSLRFSFFAYDAAFTGGVRVATGDVTGDGLDDVITAAGPGGGPHVKVFDGSNLALLQSFFAYAPTFTGGVYVAAGDVTGDGFADVVTGAGAGGGPHVEAFDGNGGALVRSFFAYAQAFTGGVRVAAGDADGDKVADIVTGAGEGGGPHVQVFRGTDLAPLRSVVAFDASFTGGVYVAAGDTDGDGRADVIVGAGEGGGPHVKVFAGTSAAPLASFFAYDPSLRGGVRVAAGDVDGDGRADVIVGPGPGLGPRVRVLDAGDQHEMAGFLAFDPAFLGGVFVG